MYWYNPTTHTSERVEAPSTDEQAIQMLAGTQDSAEFIEENRSSGFASHSNDDFSLRASVSDITNSFRDFA